MNKGAIQVKVDAMVVELEDSSHILDLEAPVEANANSMCCCWRRGGGVGVDADVVGDVGCTPTKKCSDVVALAPPAFGMVFSSWQEVETYYKAYARHRGLLWSELLGQVTRPKIRQGNVGMLNGLVIDLASLIGGERFIATYRKEEMNCHVKRKLKLGNSAGLKVAQIHNMLAKERNGLQEMAINERDVRNELYREKNLKLKDGDAKAMLEYFEKMTEGNQNLFHTYRLDNFGQICATYEEFNDVVCFDTTYLTNQYEFPFANFTTETFEWVFRTWVHCMRGIALGGILTDQAAVMRNALRSAMPETCHHWCIWHITEKFSQKLGKCKGHNEFKDELLNVIYDSLFVPEFESSWMVVINKHGLEDNLCLDGMKTTQRVESIHSFFDDYVNKHTTLAEFAEMYCRAMEKRAEMERQYDAHSEAFTRQITCGFPCESVFQHYYTDMKFKEIQHECSRIMFLHCFKNVMTSENVTEYTFEDRVWCRNKETKKEFLTQYKRNYGFFLT
ncbi:Protein FAR1-RELATED SEQUENCE 5 [Bienertia sinuspersici]